MRLRLARLVRLARLFAKGLLDHDLISPGEDLHAPIASVLAAFLVGSSVVVLTFIGKYNSILQSINGQLTVVPSRSLAETIAMARDDKLFVLSAVMAVIGLVTTLCWDSLILDERDVSVLGSLPVPLRTLVGGKMAGVGGAAAAGILALNVLPALLFPLVVLAKEPVGLLELVRWTPAQFTAGVLGCGFVFLSVVVFRTLAAAVLGPRAARAFLPIAQGALVLGCFALLLTSPIVAGSTRHALQSGSGWIFLYPPTWFLGLEEVLIGQAPGVLQGLARISVIATAVALLTAALVTVATLPAASQRRDESGTSASSRWIAGRFATGRAASPPRQFCTSGLLLYPRRFS